MQKKLIEKKKIEKKKLITNKDLRKYQLTGF